MRPAQGSGILDLVGGSLLSLRLLETSPKIPTLVFLRSPAGHILRATSRMFHKHLANVWGDWWPRLGHVQTVGLPEEPRRPEYEGPVVDLCLSLLR